MAQINALVRHHEIVGEDKVTAPHLSGKWISVQEFVSQNEPTVAVAAPPAPKASVVPPRPDERTLTSITAPSHHSGEPRKSNSNSDAVLNLFEILQAARERKPQNPTPNSVGHSVIEMPRPVKTSSGAGLFWLAVPAMVVVAIAAWKMTSSNPAPAPVAENETPVKAAAPAPAQKSAPVTASAPAAKPVQARTVATTTPPPRAKTVISSLAPNSIGRQALHPAPAANDRERERELEREREREAERELEREKARDAEYARSGSQNDSYRGDRERERERETERDHRDSKDRSTASNNASGNGANDSGNGTEALVTGGTPADPAAFRDNPDNPSRSNSPQFQ
ncbi:MAG: hypothetical protein ACJ763_13510 [Bdellovibrionia bacterium]